MEHWQHIILFSVGAIAGFLNVISGGGSTISLPVLIFMGLDTSVANGTNRIAIIVQNISAVSAFRLHDVHEFKKSSMLSLFTLPGAVIGALFAVKLPDVWFQRILGIVMIGIVVSMFVSPVSGRRKPGHAGYGNEILTFSALFAIGFYGGFIQVGVGFLFMAALYHLAKMDLVRVNMHKVFIVLIYTFPALGIFILTGNVDWILGLILGAGSAAGGWIGARVSVKGGEKIIRIVLGVSILIMSLKLFEAF